VRARGEPTEVVGGGLSDAGHVEETAASFDPGAPAPVFIKHTRGVVRDGASVPWPESSDLVAMAEDFEPGVGEKLRRDVPELDPLLDYEVELGVVLLEDIDPASLEDPEFAPKLGFFIANDLSARSLALLGEGMSNRYEYWGLSKSLPGFLPVGGEMFVPAEHTPSGLPCVELETRVNGEVRQKQRRVT